MNGNDIFRDDKDREQFTETVREYKELCGAKVYHWCWMDTHFHMLAEVVFDNLRAFAGGIQQVHAGYCHKRYGTSGVFWAGRYKSKPVEIGEYLARCGRYIERNPARAGIVERAWDYEWSSAACYVAGKEDGLTTRNEYVFPGELSGKDRKEYGAILMSTEDDEWMEAEKNRAVLGSERFVRKLRAQGGRFRRKRGRPVQRANNHITL